MRQQEQFRLAELQAKMQEQQMIMNYTLLSMQHQSRSQKCQYCKENFQPRLIESHQLECDFRPVDCEYCGIAFPTQIINDHYLVCPKQLEIQRQAIQHPQPPQIRAQQDRQRANQPTRQARPPIPQSFARQQHERAEQRAQQIQRESRQNDNGTRANQGDQSPPQQRQFREEPIEVMFRNGFNQVFRTVGRSLQRISSGVDRLGAQLVIRMHGDTAETIPMHDRIHQRIMQGVQQRENQQNLLRQPRKQDMESSLMRGENVEFKFQPQRNLSPSAKNCTICQDEYQEHELVKVLKCFHRFHSSCVDSWFQRSKLCPVCKLNAID